MTLSDKDQIEVDASINYRGKILHYIAHLELMLNIYIAAYFCGKEYVDKITNMQLLILGDERMSFSNKIQVFHVLAVKYEKSWYDSYKSIRPQQLKKPKYTLNQDLVYAIEQRNILAHRILDIGTDGFCQKPKMEDCVRFIRFKNEVEPIDYTFLKFTELSALILSMTVFLGKKIPPQSTLAPSD